MPTPLTKLQRDVGRLLDASDEVSNNFLRNEDDWLRVNLRAVFELAEAIRRRRKGKRMRRLLGPGSTPNQKRR